MKMKKPVPVVLTVVLLIVAIAISAFSRKTPPKHTQVKSTAATPSQATVKEQDETLDDMRGVWITYMELTTAAESDKSEDAFRQKFEGIAADCKAFGCNTLVVQVRPFCDALYASELFPASHIISGEQGKNADFDPLAVMCEIAKENDLRIHAWVNPYRVTANNTPDKLSDNNPYVKDSSLGLECESGIILDPSNESARKLIIDGIMEIVNNYDIDGIQFDDYFYPADIGNADEEQYNAYLDTVPEANAMSLEVWRSFNVSLLVSETYLSIHRSRDDVVFGISPQGNLNNNEKLCADVASWCGKKGFVDYICPQIYFSLDNPKLGFEAALNDWTALEYADGVRLYVGLAGYKAGTDADEGTWLERDDILAEEYNILIKNNNVSGFMLYSCASLNDSDAQQEIQNLEMRVKS